MQTMQQRHHSGAFVIRVLCLGVCIAFCIVCASPTCCYCLIRVAICLVGLCKARRITFREMSSPSTVSLSTWSVFWYSCPQEARPWSRPTTYRPLYTSPTPRPPTPPTPRPPTPSCCVGHTLTLFTQLSTQLGTRAG